jgi:ubiquinone/menaquinone biosynthesis C-methylase UbiE
MERHRLTALFDRAAPLYDTVEPRFFREIARRLVARLSELRWSRVLDVATGPGIVLAEIARSRALAPVWSASI